MGRTLSRALLIGAVSLASLAAVALTPDERPDASVGEVSRTGAERVVGSDTNQPSADEAAATGTAGVDESPVADDGASGDTTETDDETTSGATAETDDEPTPGSTAPDASEDPASTSPSSSLPGATPSTTTTGAPSTSTTVPSSSTSSTTTTAAPVGPTCCGEGDVGLFVNARSEFIPWLDKGEWQWMDQNYEGMLVYESYWDDHIGRVGGEWVYKDAMAIYVDTGRDSRSVDHPDWVLRDAGGGPIYLDFACGGGCPQYAADVGNPAFVADFIAAVQVLVDRGYTGLMLDDVNLRWVFSDVNGNNDVEPIDPRTGAVILIDDWQRYMADFMESIRAAFPGLRIMHNVIWFADTPGMASSHIDRQIAAADMLQLERGATDPNFPDGNGTYGFQTFLRYVARAEALGTDVVLLDEGSTDIDLQEFNLAATLLINDGGDYVSTENFNLIGPTDLWIGFGVDLGHALGPWYEEGGVLRRDFTGGLVVLNEPTKPTVTVALPAPMIDLAGATVNSVTLPGFHAAVLRSN
ncbi:MAG: putative glycoside hydrolase [Actinomycetota bacterium]